MDILLLIKDLITNMHLIGMFVFTFIILLVIFRDPQAIIKVLRKILTSYIIVSLLFNIA